MLKTLRDKGWITIQEPGEVQTELSPEGFDSDLRASRRLLFVFLRSQQVNVEITRLIT